MLLALLRKAHSLRIPWSLRRRLARWIVGAAAREYPWALGLGNALLIAGLVALGATESWLGWIALAGLLVGLGTRMGGGCTSGHGVCGLGRLSPRSLIAVIVFMAAGMAATYVMRHLISVGA